MKLLYTRKQFQGELEKQKQKDEEKYDRLSDMYYSLSEEKVKLDNKYTKLKEENKEYQTLINLREEEIKRLENMIKELKSSHRKLASAKGGLIKKINELQDELSEAQIKLSQRFIIKELKPEKVKNTQVMKTKSSTITSRIAKKMKEVEND